MESTGLDTPGVSSLASFKPPLDEPVARLDSTQNKFIPAPIEPGPEGDLVVLLLFGTGVRGRSSLGQVNVRIGGVDAQVLYAGPQGLAGIDQINVAIPRDLAGRGRLV